MSENCFVCGKEIAPGREIMRKRRSYCSLEHAREKRPAPTASASAPTQPPSPAPAATAPGGAQPASTSAAEKAKPVTP